MMKADMSMDPVPDRTPLLILNEVEKTFAINGVKAVDRVSLSLLRGEVVALMGENGAGKSTLAALLGGRLKPDRGGITYMGKGTPGVVHQKPVIHESFTVGDMILAGHPRITGSLLAGRKSWDKRINGILENLGAPFLASDPVVSLKEFEWQLIELAEMLLLKKELIILDEPEFPSLPVIIDFLQNKSITTVLITHKMEEAGRLTDRIIIMRKGALSLDSPSSVSESTILSHFLPVSELSETKIPSLGERNRAKGKILAVAGLRESGLAMEEKRLARELSLLDGYLPSKMRNEAMEESWSAMDNLMIHDRYNFSGPFGFIEKSLWKREGGRFLSKSRVKAKQDDLMEHLSGGNQKKLILHRELNRPGDKVLLAEPASALDFSNREELYNQIRETRDRGKDIILLTSDPEEALALADNIVPLYEGKRGIEKKALDYTLSSLTAAMRGRT